MPETPREYKKRIEEKWKKNEKNKEKLIKKIEWYELLDERFKTKTKKEILANFEKNQKAELESEQYTMIVTELWKIDKKYEELDTLEEQLKAKKKEKDEIEKEIKWLNLDWADETTLNLQWANVRKLNEKLESIKSEIEGLDKEINNMEQEIKVIEDSYWKKIDNNDENNEVENQKGKESKSHNGYIRYKPETLKEVHEQTIKELWEKDGKRNEIIKILDKWVWIDNELKEKIKEEIFKRFFEYYDEKQWNLKVKSARYIKNKLKHTEKIRTEEKEELETIYWVWVLWKEKMSEIIGTTIKTSNMICKIWWKNVYEAEDENWKHYILNWENLCWEWYDTVRNVRNVWWELVFLAKKNWKSYLIRWDTIYEDVNNIQREWWEPKFFTCIVDGEVWLMHWKNLCWKWFDKNCKIKEIKEIWWKIVYQVKNSAWFWEVYRWNKSTWEWYEKIHEIKEIWWEAVFTAERDWKLYLSRWDTVYRNIDNLQWKSPDKPFYTCESGWKIWFMYWTEKLKWFDKVYRIWEVKEIWWKIVFAVKDNSSFWEVYQQSTRCWNWYKEIWSIKDVCWKPAFWGRRYGGTEELVRWFSEIKDNLKWVYDPIDIWWKPTYKIVNSSWSYEIYRWRERCWNAYDKISDIKEVDGKPNFTWIRGGVKHEVLWTEEI